MYRSRLGKTLDDITLSYVSSLKDDSDIAFYDTPANQTLVTASNDGSVAKQDITKEVWKRLYHNAPYLLKTKGTERGLRALMSCYGDPASMLNVKEYGGPTKDKSTYKIFTYDKLFLFRL